MQLDTTYRVADVNWRWYWALESAVAWPEALPKMVLQVDCFELTAAFDQEAGI